MKKIANSQLLRSRVANAVVFSSKAAGDAVDEVKIKALWREAGNSIFESADKDEGRDTTV